MFYPDFVEHPGFSFFHEFCLFVCFIFCCMCNCFDRVFRVLGWLLRITGFDSVPPVDFLVISVPNIELNILFRGDWIKLYLITNLLTCLFICSSFLLKGYFLLKFIKCVYGTEVLILRYSSSFWGWGIHNWCVSPKEGISCPTFGR